MLETESVLVICRSATVTTVVVAVAVLLARFGSVRPAGVATVAVSDSVPLAVDEGRVPVTV